MHGVSGTPPEALLDRPLVTQVDGDRVAGFYRPRLPEERADAAPDPFAEPIEPAADLEGYAWGGLTSGSPGRAFWLVLLPFTLMNVAPRARPEDRNTRRVWLIWYLARLLALAQTLLLVLTFCGIGIDLVGWQCQRDGDVRRCAGAQPHWLFDWVFDRSHDGNAALGVLLGALLPGLAIGALWLIGRLSLESYERVDVRAPRDMSLPAEADDADEIEVGLGSLSMWRGESQVRRLRSVHVQCAIALVLIVVLMPTAGVRRWWIVVPALVICYGVYVLTQRDYVGRRARTRWARRGIGVWCVLAVMCVVVVLGTLFDPRWLAPRGDEADRPLPGYGGAFFWEVLVLIGLLVVFAALICWSSINGYQQPGAHQASLRRGLRGNGASVFAALGVLFGCVFSAGLYTYGAAFLQSGSFAPRPYNVRSALTSFQVPEVARLAMVAYTWAVGVAVVVVLVTAGAAVVALRRRPTPDPVADDFPGADLHSRRATEIRRADVEARFTDQLPVVLAVLAAAGTLITGYFALGLVLEHYAHHRLPGMGIGVRGSWTAVSLAGIGSYLTMLTMTGFVTIAYAVYRVQATRRTVGILWDVASFWPRSAHPLSAPCYAERTVPDLVTRLAGYRADEPDRKLVLAGHSQGTVISAAALYQLDAWGEGLLDRIGYLSFGCPLRRLYSRYFPVYLGPARLEQLQAALGGDTPRWRNLWRRTDYIGGQVTDGPPPGPDAQAWDTMALDPPYFDRLPGHTSYSDISRHSDYWSDPSGSFQRTMAELLDTIP